MRLGHTPDAAAETEAEREKSCTCLLCYCHFRICLEIEMMLGRYCKQVLERCTKKGFIVNKGKNLKHIGSCFSFAF